MGLDEDRPFKDGHLYDAKNKKRYCQLFAGSKQGVKRLEMSQSKNKGTLNTIIPLKDCIKICPVTPQTDPPSFWIIKKDDKCQIFCKNHADMEEWVTACQDVAFSDDLEEDNELYCSTNEGDVFPVILESTEASERCKLQTGRYNLRVDAEEIRLLSEDRKVLQNWPYRFIRRYGCNGGKFKFEAGRKCNSGEGHFIFNASNMNQTIFKCVNNKMKLMKSRLSEDNADSALQQRVIGMNARSRSPLPPSPTSETHSLLSKTNSPPPPPLPPSSTKPPCPSKPPRKNLPPKNYDEVSGVNEAWRHLGINEPHHIESGAVGKMVKAGLTAPRGKVFLQQSKAPSDYDRLQHFGTTRKQSSAYKNLGSSQTTISPPSPQEEAPHSPQADIETARLADDSHGYGVIRKKLLNPLTDAHLPLELGVVVCMPHRV